MQAKKINLFKTILLIAFAWFLANLALVLFSWGKSYFIDFGPRPTNYQLDLRKDKTKQGHKIIFVATQAEPEKAWLFGHLWVAFDQTPNNEPKNTYQYGYYSKDKTEATKELAIAVMNPFGFYFGQKPVQGQIQIDDPWPHHIQLIAQVDDEDFQKALETHYKWRKETKYLIRPHWGEKSYACQDYVFAIADTIGLKTYKNHYGEFPPESFVKFAKLNGIKVESRPSFGAYFQHAKQ